MLPAYRLAQKVHGALTNEVADLQRDIVLQQMIVAEFGNDALPVHKLLRGFNNVLTNSPESIARNLKSMRDGLAEKMATIRELEAMFAEQENTDMQAFAKHMAERMKAGK